MFQRIKQIKEMAKQAKSSMEAGYEEYPDGKEAVMKVGCCGAFSEDPSECSFIKRLRGDLTNSYYWSGNPIKDYVFFVFQWHPFLGFFFCHPNHPWSKFDRLMMLLVSLFITLIPSCFIANQNFGGVAIIPTIIFITIPDIIFGVLLYQMSIADTHCPSCKGCLDYVTKFCFCWTGCFGLISTLFAVAIMSAEEGVHWKQALRPMLMGKVYSYGTWFPIWLLLPFVGFAHVFYQEKKALQEEAEAAKADDGATVALTGDAESPPAANE